MTDATLESVGEGRFRVQGDLDYVSVAALLRIDASMFTHNSAKIEVDLSGIGRITSVGLALMLEWLRLARASKKTIQFSNVPKQMLAMAAVSQLDGILQLK